MVGAALLATVGRSAGEFDWAVAAALVLALALAFSGRFDVGGGYVVASQLVFVPALLLEPPEFAPLIALCSWLLGRLPNVARRQMHPSRLVLLPADCLFSIGPAAVLTAAGVVGPSWHEWPIYVAALAAQFLMDFVGGSTRAWLALGVRPHLQLRTVAYVWAIDAALSPIGLLAAFASTSWRFGFLAVLPLAGLLVVLSQERARRMAAELESTRAREALIAGASHELQTPLAVLSGLVDTLARTPHLSEERRLESYASMQRQAGHLRHLVAQFVDYARLKAGQGLLISPRPTPVAPVLDAVAELWRPTAAVEVRAADAGSAVADPARLHGVVMALVANALKHGPAEGPVEVAAHQRAGRVVIEVADRGPGIPEDRIEEVFEELHPATDRREGSGLGLFLSRTALRAQGGDVRLRPRDGGGIVATVFLPARQR